MSTLTNKIDFEVIISATDANPNGDPLSGNRPRINSKGKGEISDVCIKRKIRNRLQDMGERIFVQSDDKCDDGCDSLRARADSCDELKKASSGKNTNKDEYARIACEQWIDVRSFGQVFALKGKTKDENVSASVRGPVSISIAKSVSPIYISSMKITKSVNSESGKAEKDSSTFGYKHRIEFGLYVFKGSINCQLAEKTGFSDEEFFMGYVVKNGCLKTIVLQHVPKEACRCAEFTGGSMTVKLLRYLLRRYIMLFR